MDLFTRFNRRSVNDRQIDTLIGISKGLIADGIINQAESEFLLTWLIQSRLASNNPIIINLLKKVEAILEDGVLDPEESRELFALLRKFSGEAAEIGELAKPTSLPVNDPIPTIIFEGMRFLFTGDCIYGNRKQCQAAIESLGGINANAVTKNLNYLIIGTYVTDSWAHETCGRKIEKAMKYRDGGMPIVIMTEEHWVSAGNIQ